MEEKTEEVKEILEETPELEKENSAESSPEAEPTEESEPTGEEEPAEQPENKISSESPESKEEIAVIPHETPRERALRAELTKARKVIAEKQALELAIKDVRSESKVELSKESQETLAGFDPDEVSKVEKLFGAIAEKRGYVKRDELTAQTVKERSLETVENFLEKHPEYKPENDKGGVLWNQFKSEYNLYREPASPKDMQRLLDKVHKDIFNIQPATALKSVNAQREKAKVASHTSTSSAREGVVQRKTIDNSGLRAHLKGFSEEEKDEILSTL